MSHPRGRSGRIRRTKIVCTIGPATESEEMLGKLARAGMDCARLNFSHGSHAEHLRTIRAIRKVSEGLEDKIAILQDLPGPKFRLGNLKDGSILLKKGMKITLVATEEDIEGNETSIPLRQKNLPRYVSSGSTIFFSDGSIKLKVLSTTDDQIRCVCQTGGQVFSGKGVNIPQLHRDFETFTDQDKKHALFGIENDVDYIAVSFVRNAEDILGVQKFVKNHLGRRTEPPLIVAKIEKSDALRDIEGIVRASNVVMVARGDLGVENPLEQVPLIQKTIIATSNRLAVPVITATQMLESMVSNPSPTRAEVTDIANAILDGTDALMLSEETAVGQHPVECVEVLNKVAITTEKRLLTFRRRFAYDNTLMRGDVRDASSGASTQISQDIGAKLIVCPTNQGTMTPKISRFRPKAPIIALTESEKTLRKLRLVWGVYPYHIERSKNLIELLEISVNKLIKENLVEYGDRIVVVCDSVELSRQTGELLFVVEVSKAA